MSEVMYWTLKSLRSWWNTQPASMWQWINTVWLCVCSVWQRNWQRRHLLFFFPLTKACSLCCPWTQSSYISLECWHCGHVPHPVFCLLVLSLSKLRTVFIGLLLFSIQTQWPKQHKLSHSYRSWKLEIKVVLAGQLFWGFSPWLIDSILCLHRIFPPCLSLF